MGMTLTEKIFARASGKAKVSPGEIVDAKIDYAMVPDGVCSLLNDGFREIGTPVWDKGKVVIVIDHASPPCIVGHTKWVMDTTEHPPAKAGGF
jgi:3-isopropylmalate/(R)-2-methylmalate dehydratase large subunit